MNTILIVNALTALGGTVVSLLLGMVWYSQKFFGKTWMEFNGMDMSVMQDPAKMAEAKKGMGATFALAALASFVMFFVFAFMAVFIGQLNFLGVLVFSAVLWLGFAVPMSASTVLWSGKSKKMKGKMFLISSGYYLITFLVTGIIWVLIYPHFFF